MRSGNTTKSILVAALAHAVFAANAVTVLTTFETPELGGTSNGPTIFQFSPAQFSTNMAAGGIPGWSSNAQVAIAEVGDNLPNNTGAQFLMLGPNDVATYAFSNLTVGTTYSLAFSFDYSGSAASGSSAGNFAVKDGSNFVITTTNLLTDTPNNSAAGTYLANLGQATSQNLTFTAAGTTLDFIFSSAVPAGLGATLAIDNVSVNIAPLPIPEPETTAMLLAGLGAMAFVAKRRRPRVN